MRPQDIVITKKRSSKIIFLRNLTFKSLVILFLMQWQIIHSSPPLLL